MLIRDVIYTIVSDAYAAKMEIGEPVAVALMPKLATGPVWRSKTVVWKWSGNASSLLRLRPVLTNALSFRP
jgi:hypothetical protein